MMSIGLTAGNVTEEIGTPDFFHCFFSNISHHLENEGWGSRFPVLLGEFYQGRLDAHLVQAAREELATIRKEFSKIPPGEAIWDIDNLAAKAPWGENISRDINDLSHYFTTSGGRNLFEVLEKIFQVAIERQTPILIG